MPGKMFFGLMDCQGWGWGDPLGPWADPYAHIVCFMGNLRDVLFHWVHANFFEGSTVAPVHVLGSATCEFFVEECCVCVCVCVCLFV